MSCTSYRPLFNYKFRDGIYADEIIKEINHYTITNPKNEISLISNIKTVNQIKNNTSFKIRNQYETFPILLGFTVNHKPIRDLFRNI